MATRRGLIVNVMPNEVLFPDISIVVESRGSRDPESAQSSIVVRGVRGQVRLSRGGRVASWSAEGALPPGHHMLLISGLLTDKRRRIEDELQIPFCLTDSKAKVPRTVRVESMARLRVQHLRTERFASDRRPSGK